ncbi:MAG: hypothetical protein XD91_1758 [Clostridiales bacterium 38_11]|nr:MAG: hypothetical protein XD91_1758 [Clostridiales bacterium 38_11]HBH13418.1 DUF1292 domain-containing protein [Clostridiales bacterium]
MDKENNCCCSDDNLENQNCCEGQEDNCCDDGECADDECGECGCGCGHEHDDFEPDTMMVTFDDGEEKECLVLAVVEFENKEYIALLPEEEEEYFIYGYQEDEEGVELIAIESDDEFNKVGAVFEELFDQEF